MQSIACVVSVEVHEKNPSSLRCMELDKGEIL